MNPLNLFKMPGRIPVPPEKRLSRQAALTITIHSLFQFGASMAGLFLNLYLWRLTESLTVNGVYNIILYAMTPIGFAVGGWIAKRKDRLVTYRLGIFMMALFFLLVIIARERVVSYYAVYAVLNGLSSGLYWVGYLVMMYDVTSDRNRIRYLGLNTAFFNAAGLAGPALAGWIIGRSADLQGYVVTFMLSFAMFIVAALVSLRIRTSSSRHKSYYLKLMPQLMRKQKAWSRALAAFFVYGLFQGIMLFLPTILIYDAVGREDLVGYLGVGFSAVVIVTAYMMSRLATESLAGRYLLASVTMISAGSLFLLIDIRFWTITVFMVLFSIANPMALNTLNTYYYRLLGTLPLKGHLRNEAVVMREVFVNLGRILSIVCLVTLAQDVESVRLPIVLACAALLQYAIIGLTGFGARTRPPQSSR